jgi:UrcA family protein
MTFGSKLALSVSLALASAAAPALAQPTAPKRVAVAYGDLDLTHPDGARALYTRIRAAARAVCAPARGQGAGQQVAWNACRREALDRAVAQLGSEAIARLHATRTTRSSGHRPS